MQVDWKLRSNPQVTATLTNNFRILAVAWVLAFSATVHATPPDPALLLQVETLLGERKPAEALSVLQARAAEFAGEPQFDYLLGLAALDAHEPALAIPALQRVLAAQPKFTGARLELARAFFEHGDSVAARNQFSQLLAEDLQPVTRSVVEEYLAKIDQRDPPRRSRFEHSWYADFGVGYDSNANGSTSDTEFLGFTLNPQFVEIASPFVELGVGGIVGMSWSTTRGGNMYGRVIHRANTDASFVNETVTLIGAAYNQQFGPWRITLGANGFSDWLAGAQHQHAGNLELGVTRSLTEKVELAVLARGGVLEYDQPGFRSLDVDRYLGGISLTHYSRAADNARFGIAFLGGSDKSRRLGAPWSNDKWGARLYGGRSLGPERTLYAEVLFLDTRFPGTGFFAAHRRDKQVTANLGLEIRNWPRSAWLLSPQLRFTDNRSTVSVFGYQRFEAMLFARRLFD